MAVARWIFVAAHAWTLGRAVFCKLLTKENLEAEMFGRPQYKVVNLYSYFQQRQVAR